MKMNSHVAGNWMKSSVLSVFLLGVVVGLSTTTRAQPGEPSRQPILRIETGMHSSQIWHIGTDASNNYLVSASDDKTLRVWEVKTGRLLNVLRPPIGGSTEGELGAVAISPDGTTIATSGLTGFNGNASFVIYLFERSSGRLAGTIGGLPRRILNLVFSKDGRYLAATSALSGGVRVYRTNNYVLVGSDAEYADRCTGAAFDSENRLVTASYDGFVRLYGLGNGNLELITKRRFGYAGQPASVDFDATDTKIAVGFSGEEKVEVLSGRDLSHLYSPQMAGEKGDGDLRRVLWSADGRTLYGAGYHNMNGVFSIRAWSAAGRGSFWDIPVSSYQVTHMVALRDGGVAYSSADPQLGVADTGDRARVIGIPRTIDYEANRAEGRFLVAAAGDGVRFSYDEAGTISGIFELAERRLSVRAKAFAHFRSSIHQASGVHPTDLYRANPTLNGTALPLEPYEETRSYSMVPRRNELLLGTTLRLLLLDDKARIRWQQYASNGAVAINTSEDGRLVITTLGDGTIRWYRMADGEELLAFFPHADRKRWVLWTPSGYYDASPGAEDLIGWHVNNGKDQAADFFPVGQFRSTYYRPDVISKVLEAGDEARALQLANEVRGRKAQTSTVAQMLPPVVEIASPSDNSEVSASEVTIRYSLRTSSGEAVTNVRALVDGRPVTGNRQLTREDASASAVRELRISVPERDIEVSIIAENRFAASVPATIRLRWRGAVPATGPSADTFVIQPKLYVLAIGVSQYQNASYSLKFAAKDAQDFAAAATIQKGLLYRDVVVKVLTDQHATKDEILDGLDWIRKETTSKDVAMVFFAGHGLNDQNGVYYFLPYNTDLEKLLRTGVPFTDIKSTVQSLAGKTLFFIDTCHSGNVLGGRRGLADDLNGIINELSSAESGAVVFAASTGNQYSLEDAKWNNGAFTKALVEGFTGRADYSGKGRITINMLDLYISERVKELTGGKQTPTTAKPNTVPDFPIAVKR
jgi:WD40 repeat protein